MNHDVRWYRKKGTYIIAACVLVLLYGIWFWRDWVGLSIDTDVQAAAAHAFQVALDTSAAECTSFQKNIEGDKTLYLPDYTDGTAGARNAENLKSLFVYLKEPGHAEVYDLLY